jgi:tRNA/tmRNA/rRNA uracil-C5-methylase (TrmA/RlmC/RlmD family)
LLGPVEVGPVAHGGHCVARLPLDGDPDGAGAGRVLFVRHTLPGERVMVRVTDDSHARFWRADAVEVLEASPDRVPVRCPVAGPGLCGGCDFQHVDLAAQRRLKTAVVAEQLQRLAGIDWDGEVVGVDTPDTADGLHWRTRMRYQVDDDGRAGLRAHRSHVIVSLPAGGCPIAHRRTPGVQTTTWPPGSELVAVAAADGEVLLVDGARRQGAADVTEEAAGRRWEVAADGFWQVHPAAADTLVDAVLAGLRPRPGEQAFDLYCGVGLFAGALAAAGCRVWGLEAGHGAILAARRNLEDFGDRVRLRSDRVERGLAKLPKRTDLVVLDPPRSGAGKEVVAGVLARRPRAVAYVACDPAALARDLGTAARHGYAPTSIRGFDLFPMTQHVECVAILAPTG